MSDTQILRRCANSLREAETSQVPIAPLSQTEPLLTLQDGYEIQWMNAAQRLKEGQRLIGYKVGLTSKEAQQHFKVFHPDYGHLFDSMAVPSEGMANFSRLIQPKIEGEIAFVLGKDLKGPGLTLVDIMGAVDYAVSAIEIIDSRIQDWKITATDTIADNGSSALFVLSGKKCKLDQLNLPFLGMSFSCNSEVVSSGCGAAVMGNPLLAVTFLANELGKRSKALLAGEVILSGAISAMLTAQPGNFYTCEVLKLGSVSVRFSGGKND